MTEGQLSFNRSIDVCVTTFPSGLGTTAINALQPPPQQRSGQSSQKQE
jgi:hypothetical protein